MGGGGLGGLKLEMRSASVCQDHMTEHRTLELGDEMHFNNTPDALLRSSSILLPVSINSDKIEAIPMRKLDDGPLGGCWWSFCL